VFAVLTLRKTIKGIMAKMRAAQIARPGGEFETVEREIPSPGAGQLRIKLQSVIAIRS